MPKPNGPRPTDRQQVCVKLTFSHPAVSSLAALLYHAKPEGQWGGPARPTPAAAQAASVPAAPYWMVTIGGELRIGPKWAGAPDGGTFRPTGGPLFSIRKVGTPPEYFGPRQSRIHRP